MEEQAMVSRCEGLLRMLGKWESVANCMAIHSVSRMQEATGG